MALNFTTAPIAFTKGLDTRSQRKLVVPGKWDTLVNVSLSEDGSLKRRDGFATLIDGQAGNGLATRNNELLVVNRAAVSTVGYSSTAGIGVAKQVPGEVPFVDIGKFEVVSNGANHDQQDVAYGDGYACYVWRDYAAGGGTVTGINCTLVDLDTGAKLVDNVTIRSSATIVSPRVVFANNAFFIFGMDTPNLYCAVIATSAPTTVGTTVSIQFDANMVNKNFDACAMGSQTYVAYVYSGGTTSVRAVAVTRTGTVPAVSSGPLNVVSEANVTNASIQALTVCAYAGANLAGVFLVHTAGGAIGGGLVGAVITNATFTVSTGATLLDATVPPVASATHVTAVASGVNMRTFFDQQSSYLTADIRPLRDGLWGPTLATVASGSTIMRSATYRINAAEPSGLQGPFIAGKAFTDGTSTFLPVCMLENYNRLALNANTDTLSTQCSFYVLNVTTVGGSPKVVGGALYRVLGLLDPTGGGAAPTVGTPCSTPALAEGFGICLQEMTTLQLTNGFRRSPVDLSHVTMIPRTTTPAVRGQLAESTYFAGGMLGNYDGKQVFAHTFPNFPEGISAVVSAPGGGTKLTVGVHQVVAIYEWIDGAGNRHQSAPSLPVSVTVANASDQINVLVPTTQLPSSSGYDSTISTLNIVCYMTAAGGLTFYRAISSFTPVSNSVVASSVAYTIGAIVMTDDRLTANELLYTQPNQSGSTLSNLAPGPRTAIAVSQKRLWGFLSDEPGEFAYSQEPIQNTGLQFNDDNLGGSVPSDAGDGVAIVELDDKTILFCERRLYVVYGNGPSPSGGFNNFSDPQPVPSDVGCSEARSIIAIPGGIMFKSKKGWQLLGRDLSVNYIGDGVARWDSYDVTSAVMMEDRQEVRFTSSSAECPTLVYSYLNDAWSVFYMGNLLHPGKVTDAVWWPATGRYVHLQPQDAIFPGLMQDVPGSATDGDGTLDPLSIFIYIRTGWLHLASLEGFQRARRLYVTASSRFSPESTFVIGVDFDDAYAGPASYTATANLGTMSFDSLQAIDLRHQFARQKCKSVAISFLETNDTPDGAVLTGIQALSLEVGVKSGVNKLPATQTVG